MQVGTEGRPHSDSGTPLGHEIEVPIWHLYFQRAQARKRTERSPCQANSPTLHPSHSHVLRLRCAASGALTEPRTNLRSAPIGGGCREHPLTPRLGAALQGAKRKAPQRMGQGVTSHAVGMLFGGIPCNAGSPRLGSIYMVREAGGQAGRGSFESVGHPREPTHGTRKAARGRPRPPPCSAVIPRAPKRNRAYWRFPPPSFPTRAHPGEARGGGRGGLRAGGAEGFHRLVWMRIRKKVRGEKVPLTWTFGRGGRI